MTQYRLIHNITGEEHICKKVSFTDALHDYIDIESNKFVATNCLGINVAVTLEKCSICDMVNGHKLSCKTPSLRTMIPITKNRTWTDQDMSDFALWTQVSNEADNFFRQHRVTPDMDGLHNKKHNENMIQLLELWKNQQLPIIYYE